MSCKQKVVPHLESLVSQYADSDVRFVLEKTSVEIGPVTTIPSRVFGVDPPPKPFYNFTRPFQFRKERKRPIAWFFLFPEKEFGGIPWVMRYLCPYIGADGMDHVNIYVHLLHSTNLMPRTMDLSCPFTYNKINIRFMVYQMSKDNDIGHNDKYTISKVSLGVPGPSILYNLPPVHFYPLAACSGSQMLFCRASVDAILSRILTFGGRFFIEPALYRGDLFSLYLSQNMSTVPGFFSLKSALQKRFNNPFKRYPWVTADPSTLRRVLQFLALETFDIWLWSGHDMSRKNVTQFLTLFGLAQEFGTEIALNLMVLLLDSVEGDEVLDGNSGLMSYLVLLTGEESMNFVTCDGGSQSYSLHFYVEPYDFPSWVIFLIVTFGAIPVCNWIPHLVCYGPIQLKSVARLIGSVSFVTLSLAFEKHVEYPNRLRKRIGVITNFKVILLLWALLTVILVNAYRGLVTSKLALPPPVYPLWTNVTPMEGFTFFTETQFGEKISRVGQFLPPFGYRLKPVSLLTGCECYPGERDVIDRVFKWGGDSCQKNYAKLEMLGMREMSLPIPTACNTLVHIDAFEESITRNRHNSTQFQKLKAPPLKIFAVNRVESAALAHKTHRSPAPFTRAFIIDLRFHTIFNEMLKYRRNYTEIVRAIDTCAKTAYFDYANELDALLYVVSRKEGGSIYLKGKEKMFHVWKGIKLSPKHDGIIQMYAALQLYMAHGLYHVWSRWNTHFHPTDAQILLCLAAQDQLHLRPRPLNLKSNVVTIFFVLLGLCACAAFVCGLESFNEVLFYMIQVCYNGYLYPIPQSIRRFVEQTVHLRFHKFSCSCIKYLKRKKYTECSAI